MSKRIVVSGIVVLLVVIVTVAALVGNARAQAPAATPTPIAVKGFPFIYIDHKYQISSAGLGEFKILYDHGNGWVTAQYTQVINGVRFDPEMVFLNLNQVLKASPMLP